MTTTISGLNGVSKVAAGVVGAAELATAAVTTPKIADFAVTAAKTQLGSTPFLLRLSTSNGNGSTNTAIRRMLTVLEASGDDLTYADSATLGGTLTCVDGGLYLFEYIDAFSTQSRLGLSRNSNQLNTSIESITASHRLGNAFTSAANNESGITVPVWLVPGDVVRMHCSGAANAASPTLASLTVVRLA